MTSRWFSFLNFIIMSILSYKSEIYQFARELTMSEYYPAPSSWREAKDQFEKCKSLVKTIKLILAGHFEDWKPTEYEQKWFSEALDVAYTRGKKEKDEVTIYGDQDIRWTYCGYVVDRRCKKVKIGISH